MPVAIWLEEERRDLRVGVLGAGYFAAFHHEAWQRIAGAELVAVADRDLDRAAAVGVAAFGDVDAMLALARPDILDIATPPPSHAEAIEAGIAAGARAIVCQKPFGTSLSEARRLAEAAEAASIPLIIHENIQFQPWCREMRKALDQRELGNVHQMTFRFRTGDRQGPNAYLDRQPYFQKMERLLIHETAVHWVDTFAYLLGPIRGVYADLQRRNPVIAGEDSGLVIFDFDEGRRAIFDGNRLIDHDAENHRLTLGEALLEGDAGVMTLDGAGCLGFRAVGTRHPLTRLAPQTWPGFAGDCVYALQSHVIEAFAGLRPFENEAKDYLAVREVQDAIYASAEAQARVTL